MKKLFLVLFVLVSTYTSTAQDLDSNFNHFYSYNFDYKLNKKIKFYAGELFSFNSDTYTLRYTQLKIGARYRFSNRAFSTELYYKPLLFKGNTKDIWYHKLAGSVTHRSKVFSLPLKNSLTAEWFFPQLKKYQYRFIYAIKLSFKNDFLPLRATPYLKYQLYYYLSGEPLNYFDESGKIVATNAPNDFHRYRIGAGIRFRPVKNFHVTIYYIWQEEFNTTFTNNRQLNILNENQTAIKDPFNDYQVLGLSLTYSLK